LHAVEQTLGRRRGQRWEARVLDLDLLLYDDRVIRTSDLTVPHPGLAYRRFVLEPAAEVAPDLRHPTIGWTVGRLLAHLNAAPNYVALRGSSRGERVSFAVELARAAGAQPLTVGELDSPVQSWEQGIEFLAAMRRSLTPVFSGGTSAFVSDFCWNAFPERLNSLAGEERQRLIAVWQSGSHELPVPKLQVVLGECPSERDMPRAIEGPSLRVEPNDPAHDALTEVVAAMEAMR
jgi:hypothetical protein